MRLFRGEDAIFYLPERSYDENKDEVVAFTPVRVANVLFGTPSTEQYDEAMRLYSVRAQYSLAIPKTFKGSLRGGYAVRASEACQDDPPKYWFAGDAQPYPPHLCPTDWDRLVTAGWIDG